MDWLGQGVPHVGKDVKDFLAEICSLFRRIDVTRALETVSERAVIVGIGLSCIIVV